MEFLTTNINDIIAYALIIINAIMVFISQHQSKSSNKSLNISLREFIKRSSKEHNEKIDKKINWFQDNAYRQLADEISRVKGLNEKLELRVKEYEENAQRTSITIQRLELDLKTRLDKDQKTLLKLNQDINTYIATGGNKNG